MPIAAKKSLALVLLFLPMKKKYYWKNTIKQLVNTITKFIEDPEIIIINDGSTDLTGQIAEEFAKSHKFIFLITKNKIRDLEKL